MKIIDWVNEYEPKNSIDVENALREIMQEVALAGLESRCSVSIRLS